MKIVCIDNSDLHGKSELTIGKIYDMVDTDEDQYPITYEQRFTHTSGGLVQVADDLGQVVFFYESRFRKLSDVREDKLRKIGI